MNKNSKAIIGVILSFLITFSCVFGITYYLTLRNDSKEINNKLNDLEEKGIYAFLRNVPLQYKMSVFYQYVRENELKMTTYYDFLIKLILHDTGMESNFTEYSEVFRDAWITNNSMQEANLTFSKFSPSSSHWNYLNPTASSIHKTVREQILFLENFSHILTEEDKIRYTKSAIETAADYIGSSYDIAILEATLLKHCGYGTVVGFANDNNQTRVSSPNGFHRGFIWIKINTTDFTKETNLWRFGNGNYEWLLLDPTCEVYGDTPYWLSNFYDSINFTNWKEIFTWRIIASSNSPELQFNNLIPSHEYIYNH